MVCTVLTCTCMPTCFRVLQNVVQLNAQYVLECVSLLLIIKTCPSHLTSNTKYAEDGMFTVKMVFCHVLILRNDNSQKSKHFIKL